MSIFINDIAAGDEVSSVPVSHMPTASLEEGVEETHDHNAPREKASSRGSLLKENEIPIHPISSHLSTISVPASRSYSLVLDASHGPLPISAKDWQAIKKASSVSAQPQAKAKTTSKQYKRIDQIKWTSPEEIVAHASLLSAKDQHILSVLERKRLEFPEGFDKGNYFENTYPVLASGFLKAEKFVHCMNYMGRNKVPCSQWALCSKCAYTRGLKSSLAYGSSFGKASFYHLTCSFDGKLPFGATNSVVVQDYWNAITKAIKKLFNDGWIDGACVVHELALHSFLPVRVLPHSHVVLTADEITEGFEEELQELLTDPSLDLLPSISIRKIENKYDLGRVLIYQTEAIDLKEPYDSAWDKHVLEDRKMAIELNLQMKEFLDAFGAALNNFTRVVHFGNLRSTHGTYIGIKRKDLPKPERKASPRPSKR